MPRRVRRRGGGRRCACVWCCRGRSRISERRRRSGRRYACAARCSCCRERSRSANEPEPRARGRTRASTAGAVRVLLTRSTRPPTSCGSKRTALPMCTAQRSPRSTRRCTVRGWTRRTDAASSVVSSATAIGSYVARLADVVRCGTRSPPVRLSRAVGRCRVAGWVCCAGGSSGGASRSESWSGCGATRVGNLSIT